MDAGLILSGLSVVISTVAVAVAIGANRKSNNIGTAELKNSDRLKELEEQRFAWEASDRVQKKQQEQIELLMSAQQGAEKLAAKLAVHWASKAIHIINNGPHTAWDVSWTITNSDGNPVGMDHAEASTDKIPPGGAWRYLHPRAGGTVDSLIHLKWIDGLGEHTAFPTKLSMDNTVTIDLNPDS